MLFDATKIILCNDFFLGLIGNYLGMIVLTVINLLSFMKKVNLTQADVSVLSCNCCDQSYV